MEQQVTDVRALIKAIDRCRDNAFSDESKAALVALADAISERMADSEAERG